MIKVIEIAFSCYPVTDMARARKFYEGVLGLKPTMHRRTGGMQWAEYDIGRGTLALGCGAPDWMPQPRRLLGRAGSGGFRRRRSRICSANGVKFQHGADAHAGLPHGVRFTIPTATPFASTSGTNRRI